MILLFSERLRILRKEKGLKQEELAQALGCTQRRISYLENGTVEPDLTLLWKTSDYFQVTCDYLIGKADY